jgi:(p)ppGpp synthase/HD superfamily hydrolase
MASSRSVPAFLAGHPLARPALGLARSAHEGQRRALDGAPFISHPLAVARLLVDAGAPGHVIAAGLVHDVVEKSDVTLDDVELRLGPAVSALVAAVTEDPTIAAPAERKRALGAQVARAGSEAAIIYAADKIAKVGELRALLAAEGPRALFRSDTRDKLRHYALSVSVVEHALGPHPLADRLRRELVALRRLHGAELVADLPIIADAPR